jgi:3-hydroxybutyryl-CoA dehydratase
MIELLTKIEDVNVGAVLSESYTFTESAIQTFRDLIRDEAPIHWDEEFALKKSFEGRIVYGFLVASPFSRMLGMTLPGPHTVIHAISYKIHHPVYVGETIYYSIKVIKVVPSVGVVVLELSAKNDRENVVLTGTAQCGFPRESNHEV